MNKLYMILLFLILIPFSTAQFCSCRAYSGFCGGFLDECFDPVPHLSCGPYPTCSCTCVPEFTPITTIITLLAIVSIPLVYRRFFGNKKPKEKKVN